MSSDLLVGAEAAPSQPGGALAVELQGVRKLFDNGLVRAVDGVDLTVPAGQMLAVTGPSGCGKSTLLHLIAALDRPTAGTVHVAGRDVGALPEPSEFRRTQVGLVFQLHNLLPHLTAAQNVEVAMFGVLHSRAQRERRARELLARVDLVGRENRPPTKLSGGERQRVAIARALANHPPLILADEPTGSLDNASVQLVLDLFRQLRLEEPGLTMVIVTHDDRVAAVADRVVHLQDGRVVADSPAGPDGTGHLPSAVGWPVSGT